MPEHIEPPCGRSVFGFFFFSMWISFFSFLTNAARLVDKSFIDMERGLAEAGRTLQRFNFGGVGGWRREITVITDTHTQHTRGGGSDT